MRPHVTCVVPARLGSTRFFGKLLTPLFGKPVVVHALERAAGAGCFDRVVCVTDSPEIGAAAAAHGFEWVLSDERGGEAVNGTERIARALDALDSLGIGSGLFVNLQGDEPAFPEDGLRTLCAALRAEPEAVHLLVHEDVPTAEDVANPNRVKVVLDEEGLVKGFVRSPSIAGPVEAYRLQLGAYGYSRPYLERYAALPPSSGEIALSHEILRAPGLAPLRAHPARPGASVDVPEDLTAARRALEHALSTATKTERSHRPQGIPA
jgi:3-deoxy-manno-octulosonate cytidylyltransferase (CMP-KDO synthetase)